MILLAVVVFGALSVNAQKETDLVISAGNAKSIVLGKGMKVVFVAAETKSDDVTISKQALRKLQVRFENRTLELAAQAPMTDTVYVLVDSPESVELGENTMLTTDGFLKSKLDLFVSSGANAKVLTAGKLNVFPLDDGDVLVERKLVRLAPSATID